MGAVSNEREAWADWLKAGGLFAVVYGHSQAVPEVLLKLIILFTFHFFSSFRGISRQSLS